MNKFFSIQQVECYNKMFIFLLLSLFFFYTTVLEIAIVVDYEDCSRKHDLSYSPL